MKLKQFLLLTLFSIPILGFGQSQTPLLDAIAYKTAYDAKNGPKAQAILYKYNSDLTPFDDNLLIKVPDSSFFASTAGAGSDATEYRSGTAGNVQGMLIDALGTLVANRFREELTIAFLEDFRAKVKSDTLLAHVFPNTSNVLIYSDPFNHTAWMSTFRTAMEKDLAAFPENFPYVIRAVESELSLTAEQKEALNFAYEVYPILLDLWKSPNDSNIAARKFIQKVEGKISDPTAKNSLKVTRMLIDGLSADGNDWVSGSDLDAAMQSASTMKYFLAFVIEKNAEALDSINVTINSTTKSVYDHFHESPNARNTSNAESLQAKLLNVVREIVPSVKATHAAYQNISNANLDGKATFADYEPLISASLDLIDKLSNNEMIGLLDTANISDVEKVTQILKYVNLGIGFAESVQNNVESKDYSAILVDAVALLEDIAKTNNVVASNQFIMEFIKYGSLAANLASAETPEEMSSALKASVLPVGSYRIKRNNYFSVSINSYAGLFGGAEVLSNQSAKHPTAGLIGFTAPVGVGLNWSINQKKPGLKTSQLPIKTTLDSTGSSVVSRKKYLSGSSFSLFFTVIDVGAIAAFRLTDDETPVDNVQWSNVLAPGMYISIGLGSTPLALNIGGQYGPSLRKVEAKDGVASLTIDSRAFRFGAGLVVDIPLYNLYSRAEKIKKQN